MNNETDRKRTRPILESTKSFIIELNGDANIIHCRAVGPSLDWVTFKYNSNGDNGNIYVAAITPQGLIGVKSIESFIAEV